LKIGINKTKDKRNKVARLQKEERMITFELFISSLFWFLLAIVFAGLEIEAEGKYGWAEKMPTWYRTEGWVAKLYGLAMSGKPLTGYHSYMFILPLFIFHSAFFQGLPWSLTQELLVLSLYFAFAPLWDFLWFVLNPHYGLSNFSQEKIWWHAKSYWIFGKLPLDYAMGWGLSLLFACSASYLAKDWGLLTDAGDRLILFFIFLLATIFVAPWYQQWYLFMRQWGKDDRDKVLPRQE